MVYYIRFLKTPKYHPTKVKGELNVKAYITITTDLGDDFYPGQLGLTTSFYNGSLGDEISPVRIPDHKSTWKQGMRGLPVNVLLKTKELKHPLKLRMVCKASTAKEPQPLECTSILDVLTVWSDIIESATQEAVSKRVERRFSLSGNSPLSIWEETGESIARHLWDAGLGLVAHLQDNLGDSTCTLHRILSKESHPLSVLELGSGCGIVGIALAQLVSGCNVILTDLPEAMEILDHNISTARVAQQSKLAKLSLDWNHELPSAVKRSVLDLIVISDCTYNSDSQSALIGTLSALVALSPDAHVVVSMKVRHSSEAVFFGLMAEAGFEIVEHVSIPKLDDCRTAVGFGLAVIDVHVFNHKTASPLS